MHLSPNYFLIFEAAGFLFFIIITARKIYQRNWSGLFEIVSCAVFGMILEIGNTYLAHTYSYSTNFLINLAHVPIAIGLGWSIVIYCTMLLSDQYNIPGTLRPFMDALTAVMLDIAMDAVAIRLGFWHWSMPLDREWYGVPFENLVGWILVVLVFSFLIRFIRTLNHERLLTKILMILSPFLSYLGLLLGLAVFSVIAILPYQINNWTSLLQFRYSPDLSILTNPQVELWKLIILTVIMTELIHVVIWSLVKYRRNYLRNFDLVSFIALTGIHVLFLVAIFTEGIYRELPILAVISIALLMIHLLIHLLPYLINRKTIYIFNAVKEATENTEKRLDEVVSVVLK